MPIFNPPQYTGGMMGAASSHTLMTNQLPQHGNSIASSIAPMWAQATTVEPKKFRAKTKWDKALMALCKEPRRVLPEDVSRYYAGVSPEAIIEHLGGINPMFRGRPKPVAMQLLTIAPGIRHSTTQHRLRAAGLAYTLPCLIGRRKVSARLSYGGLALLDHWADKHKAFAPFVTAFVPKKARKEITLDCVDFELGGLPAKIIEDEKRQQELIDKENQRQAEEASARNKMMQEMYQRQALEQQQALQNRSRSFYHEAILAQQGQQAWVANDKPGLLGTLGKLFK